MKLKTGVLLFYFLGLSCWRVSAMPPEAAAIFEKAGVRFADADLFRVAEVYNYWGQKGESVWPGGDVATVPVLFDKKTGRFDFTLPEKDAAAPEIKAKKATMKNACTRYSGGVEFKTGYFSWKGEKLEVAEKDGRTTLTF